MPYQGQYDKIYCRDPYKNLRPTASASVHQVELETLPRRIGGLSLSEEKSSLNILGGSG